MSSTKNSPTPKCGGTVFQVGRGGFTTGCRAKPGADGWCRHHRPAPTTQEQRDQAAAEARALLSRMEGR